MKLAKHDNPKGIYMLTNRLKVIMCLIMACCCGCYESVDLTLKTSEIGNALSKSTPTVTSAKITIPLKLDCGQNKEKLTKSLLSFFEKLHEIQCEQNGVYVATADVPVVLFNPKENQSGGLSFQVLSQKNRIVVMLRVNQEKLSLLNQKIKDEFSTGEFIRDDLNLSIYMTNNSNRTFELLTKGVYSDNKAISDVTGQVTPFRYGEGKTIQLSDVTLDNLLHKSDTPYALIGILLY